MKISHFLKKTLTAGIIGASALTLAAPAANAHTTTGQFRSYSTFGNGSQYHVYANGIDWSKPVGVVYYLDGDYWTNDQSKIYNPNNASLTGMAKVANERNMVFVPVISPDKNRGGDGVTWWEDMDYNGDWFRNFANWFNGAVGIDRSNVWTIGYSGGAEFNTFELGADRQTSWRDNGGSIQVGGGGSRGMQTWPSPTAQRFSFQWYAGSNDVVGNTNPPTWSALGAAQQGHSSYRGAGYWNTSMNTVWGANHYQYNFTDILRQSLDRAGVKVRQAGPTLKGAIGDYYRSHGGAATFGNPTSEEFGLIDGGVAQEFSKNYTIYWRAGMGAHPVWFPGGIGSLYRAGGYERGHGFPVSAELGGPNGGAYQSFRKANGSAFTYYWHGSTGTHILYENGEIGRQFDQHGRSYGWGYPVTDEHSFGQGVKQVFFQPTNNYRTAVYWTAGTGAHELNERGAIHNKWMADGGVSKVGFPVTGELKTAKGGAVAYFRASNGHETGYYWSAGTGAHKLNSKGALYWYWVQNGYIDGMGFPTTDEHTNSVGEAEISFSGGKTLVWTAQGSVKVK